MAAKITRERFDGGISVIRFARPEARNALDSMTSAVASAGLQEGGNAG